MEPTIPTSILGLLLLLLLLLVVLPASLSAELLYTKVGNTITITGSNPKASGNLVIPATIENLPVTLIGEGAFTNCTSLTSVTIPNSVTTINRSAFANCNSLTTVTIPTSVTFLGSSSFSYCASLTNVTIPNTIPTLRYRTFYECNALTSITIPNNITAIGDEAFYGCNRLASVVIPNSVTSIGTNSFRNCIGLKSATIGTGVKSIGPLAFCYCTELSGVYFTGDAPAPAVDSFSNSGPTIFYLLGKTGWGTTFAGRPTSSSTAPSITSSSSAMATATLSFNFTISSNDPRATFYAIGMPPGLALNPTTGAITGIPTAIGTYCIILSANNAAGSGTQELTITIAPGPPVITSSVTATGTLGLPFSYTVVATFSPTRFEATGLPRGLAIDPNTGVIFGVPTMIGSEAVVLPAINATGKGTKTLNLNINPAPKVTATVGLWFSYKITANNSPTLFNATGLPSGFSLNPSSGVISGTPTTIGSYSVTLFASNAATTETQLINLIVNPPRPVITSPSSATATVGVPFAFTAKANNSPTLFEATGLPSGLAIHPTTGLISGIPTTKGTYTIYLSASNAGGMGNQALSLTVLPPRPVFTSSSVATAIIGQVFRFTITANFSPTRFTATGLPVGLSLDTSTGVIFGVPSIIGTSTVTVSAINEGGTGTQTLTLTVAPPPSASASEGQPFSYLVQANNPAALFNATGLPSGLSINPTTGLISGVPTTVGTYTVTLFASSATGTEIQTLTLTVSAKQYLPGLEIRMSNFKTPSVKDELFIRHRGQDGFVSPPKVVPPVESNGSAIFTSTILVVENGVQVLKQITKIVELLSLSTTSPIAFDTAVNAQYINVIRARDATATGPATEQIVFVEPPKVTVSEPDVKYAYNDARMDLVPRGGGEDIDQYGRPIIRAAVVEAVLDDNGRIIALIVLDPGYGYTKPPEVYIEPPPVLTEEVKQIIALARVEDRIRGVPRLETKIDKLLGGIVESIKLPASNANFSYQPNTIFDLGITNPADKNGSVAKAIVWTDSKGKLVLNRYGDVQVTITDPGLGYDKPPKAFFTVEPDGERMLETQQLNTEIFLLEYTDDFKQWTPVTTMFWSPGEVPLQTLDPQSATRPFRFYRLKKH